jgi:hypothetical protein
MDRYNLRLWLPLALLFGIGFLGFVIPAWTDGIVALGQRSGITADWAGFAGSIIAAVISVTITGVGVIAAWFAIKGQNRINILTREEDRIERRLPGLYDVEILCAPLVNSLLAHGRFALIAPEFQRVGLGMPESTFKEDLARALPLTDEVTRRNIGNALKHAYSHAVATDGTVSAMTFKQEQIRVSAVWLPAELKVARAEIEALEMRSRLQKVEFRDAVQLVGRVSKSILDRAHKYEARLSAIRQELDEFFDHPH